MHYGVGQVAGVLLMTAGVVLATLSRGAAATTPRRSAARRWRWAPRCAPDVHDGRTRLPGSAPSRCTATTRGSGARGPLYPPSAVPLLAQGTAPLEGRTGGSSRRAPRSRCRRRCNRSRRRGCGRCSRSTSVHASAAAGFFRLLATTSPARPRGDLVPTPASVYRPSPTRRRRRPTRSSSASSTASGGSHLSQSASPKSKAD